MDKRMLFTTKIVFDSKGSFWFFMFNVILRVAYVSICSELKSSSDAYELVAYIKKSCILVICKVIFNFLGSD